MEKPVQSKFRKVWETELKNWNEEIKTMETQHRVPEKVLGLLSELRSKGIVECSNGLLSSFETALEELINNYETAKLQVSGLMTDVEKAQQKARDSEEAYQKLSVAHSNLVRQTTLLRAVLKEVL